MALSQKRRLSALILGGHIESEDPRLPYERERMLSFARLLEPGGIEAEYRMVPDPSDLIGLVTELRPDFVFSAAHLSRAPKVGAPEQVHRLLERLGLPYVGPSPQALDLALSKPGLKERWRSEGVRTPDFFVLSPAQEGGFTGWEKVESAQDFPYIIKPAREGNSRGIGKDSVVHDRDSLRRKARETAERWGEVLVERFLGMEPDIREYTVALIGNGERALLMPAEIVFKEATPVRVITFEDKEEHRTLATALPERSEAEMARADRVRAFAARAFEAAGARDYGRCDILETGGELFAIEVNGQPMMPDRWFAACALGAGLDAEAYPRAVLLAGLARLERAWPGRIGVPDSLPALIPERVREVLYRKEA